MDAFFVSVELRRRPDLAGQPVVVGGTGRRGVVAAASYEARRFGVHSAMPSVVAMRRCPHAVFLPGDHALYSEVSAQVREIFDRYTPLVEPLSLDEAFLDVTGSIGLFGPAPEIAARIRADVDDRTGAGVLGRRGCRTSSSPSWHRSRPSRWRRPAACRQGPGWSWSRRAGSRSSSGRFSVQRLWGVGPVTLDKLHRIGVRRVADLMAVDEAVLATALGQSQARHLLALAAGSTTDPSSPNARRSRSVTRRPSRPTSTTSPTCAGNSSGSAMRLRNGFGAPTSVRERSRSSCVSTPVSRPSRDR